MMEMMTITNRQKLILNTVIDEYIDSAKPVGSFLLEEKYDFDVSPATIRNELLKLTKEGYLLQPHTSAGRVPTDKGYRFFVDEFLGGQDFLDEKIEKFFEKFGKEEKDKDSIRYIHDLLKTITSFTPDLAAVYLSDEDFFWEEGWGRVLQEPEFENIDCRSYFAQMIESLEDKIDNFNFNEFSEPKVFIGRENPFSESKDFSLIVSSCLFPQSPHQSKLGAGQAQEGFLAIVGPKRMAYKKNLELINSALELLQN